MQNKEITLQTILDVMNSKFEKINKRLDIIDDRLDFIDEANAYNRDRMHLFGNQQLRFAEQLEKFSHRQLAVEKAVFVKN